VSKSALQPLRGEVWDVSFPRVGPHPAIVLTINRLGQKLSSLTVVLVTGTDGPRTTHIPLGLEVGLTRYTESYACTTEIHTVPITRFKHRRSRLSAQELRALEAALKVVLGLPD
jgi:mRNA interferase MazF